MQWEGGSEGAEFGGDFSQGWSKERRANVNLFSWGRREEGFILNLNVLLCVLLLWEELKEKSVGFLWISETGS